jgi:nicotinate-nucleotide adenylyltransferase
MSRIGLFGGTFDPPHVGHLILASEARYQLALTRMLWVPAADPPHKTGDVITPLEQRLDMLQLAVAGDETFEISRLDIDRPGPHYTLDTLRAARAAFPGSQIILVIGGDSLRDLPAWHQPAEVVGACDEIGVMRRPRDVIDLTSLEHLLPGLSVKLHFVDAPLLDIASSEIRQRVSRQLPFKYYVPQAVHDYIIARGLYRSS